jgi:hypothetical protein
MQIGAGPDGLSPIHDRWWICERSGLRFGTSFNGLGVHDSEISTLDGERLFEAQALVRTYLERKRASASGERIDYALFSL